MIDIRQAMQVHQARVGRAHNFGQVPAQEQLRREVWRCLVGEATDEGAVSLSHAQIGAKIAASTCRPAATRTGIANALRSP